MQATSGPAQRRGPLAMVTVGDEERVDAGAARGEAGTGEERVAAVVTAADEQDNS